MLYEAVRRVKPFAEMSQEMAAHEATLKAKLAKEVSDRILVAGDWFTDEHREKGL